MEAIAIVMVIVIMTEAGTAAPDAQTGIMAGIDQTVATITGVVAGLAAIVQDDRIAAQHTYKVALH